MATSGSFNVYVNGSSSAKYWVEVSWTRTSYTSGFPGSSSISWSVTPKGNTPFLSSSSDKYKITFYIDNEALGTQEYYWNTAGSTGDALSGSRNIRHDGMGEASFVMKVVSEGLFTGSPDRTVTETAYLDTIPVPATLTSAPNFTDEDNPIIYFSCPTPSLIASLEACIEWSGGLNTVPYRGIAGEDGYYEFVLTDAERKKLRQGITTGSSRNIRFSLRTKINNYYYTSNLTRTIELINHEPVLNPGYYDQNNTIVNLTGSSSTIVRYYSNIWVDAGASARKEAILSSVRISCGEKYLDQGSGLIEGVAADKIYFTATDSRGFTTEEVLEPNFIPYVRLTASTSITSFTLAGSLTFVIEGNYYNGSFGAKDNYLQIGYKLKRNGQYLQEVNLDQTDGTLTFPRSGKYRYELTIPNLAVTDSSGSYYTYSIQTTIRDQLSRTITSQELSASAEPLFSWSKSDFKFTVPVHFERGFTDSTGLKTAVYNVNVNLNKAGSHPLCDLIDLGIDTNYQIIYSMNGTIAYWDDNLEIGKIYAVPSPALSNGTGTYSIVDATKFFVEDDVLYLTVGAAWGYVYVRLVIQYF